MTYVVSAEGQEAAAQAAGSAPLSDALRSEGRRPSIAMIKAEPDGTDVDGSRTVRAATAVAARTVTVSRTTS